jgi:DNA sulfur modification protein DndD
MIFESLVLHNFGLYQGRQEIDLRPTGPANPIILFGGLNGSGKTTLLDALQLALYGKLANITSKQGKPYREFLRDCINTGTPDTEGASVELEFLHRAHGTTSRYRVCRTWAQNGRSVKENLTVVRNGHRDELLTEEWPQHIDGIIPCDIAHLFFFDGEKIAEIAEASSTQTFLSTAVRSLLGLDAITQLRRDLEVIVRKQGGKVKNEQAQQRIATEEAQLEQVEKEHRTLLADCAALRNGVEQIKKRLAIASDKFRLAGGAVFEERARLATRLQERQDTLRDLESRMRAFSEGCGPLGLLMPMLEAIRVQANKEQDVQRSKLSLDIMRARDSKIIEFARNLALPTHLVDELGDFLHSDLRTQEQEIRRLRTYLSLRLKAYDSLTHLVASLPKILEDAAQQIERWKSLVAEIDETERALHSVPPEEAVSGLVRDVEEARQALTREEAQWRLLEEKRQEVANAVEAKKRKLITTIEIAVDEEVKHERSRRLVLRSQRAHSILDEFSRRLLQSHVTRLETLILDSLHQLLRKSRLVTAISIAPDSFEMTLRDACGEPLPLDRLSAGERQLLAVAMLWGLARASGRPVPCVIDTPLGRLDSTHRDNLIKNYFPRASHQVLLLSTDQEIDASRLSQMRNNVGRSYHLDYDDKDRVTTVKEGYFGGSDKS